jgi:hypothetical protein
MITLLERFAAWIDRRAGVIAFDGPVVLRDGSAWLRIAPTEPLRWFSTDDEALRYRASGNAGDPNGA